MRAFVPVRIGACGWGVPSLKAQQAGRHGRHSSRARHWRHRRDAATRLQALGVLCGEALAVSTEARTATVRPALPRGIPLPEVWAAYDVLGLQEQAFTSITGGAPAAMGPPSLRGPYGPLC